MASNIRDNTERHRFELDADGHVAFSNYKRVNGVLTILHSEPQALEGHGIGSALIRGVLDIARSQGLKVVTVCPFGEGLYRAPRRIRRFGRIIT
jgi:predicted GNAT family acetyltransferase